MKGRNVLFSLALTLLVLLYFFMRRSHETSGQEKLYRHPRALTFNEAALCQMGHKNLSRSDVMELLETGVLISRGSVAATYCPELEVAGTIRQQSLRLSIRQCEDTTQIVSCFQPGSPVDSLCPASTMLP